MTLRQKARPALPLMLGIVCAMPMQAQQLIGYVNTRDADITGASDVLDGQAVLTGSVLVTAKDHTAPITLGRGGTVRVCQTSVLHVTESRVVAIAAPLLFSLDRGSIEIQTMGTATDAIMTPDLRFTVRSNGPLDLRLRVARNGDTCVENRGPSAPTPAVSDPFGEAMYEVAPGQHLLFEHGSLHEVVDHESSPCGCPDAKGMSIADALLASSAAKPATPPPAPSPPVAVSAVVPIPPPPAAVQAPVQAPPAQAPAPVPDLAALQATEQAAEQAAAQAATRAAEKTATQTAAQAAERHPFPVAICEGLAPPAAVPQASPGQVHAQITDSLSYNAPAGAPTPAAAPAPGAVC